MIGTVGGYNTNQRGLHAGSPVALLSVDFRVSPKHEQLKVSMFLSKKTEGPCLRGEVRIERRAVAQSRMSTQPHTERAC